MIRVRTGPASIATIGACAEDVGVWTSSTISISSGWALAERSRPRSSRFARRGAGS